MQGSANINKSDVAALLDAVFVDERVDVYTVYSECGEQIRKFSNAAELRCYAEEKLGAQNGFLHLAIRYPESGPQVRVRKIALDPIKCAGHTFRYSADGWGLIVLQCDAKSQPLTTCRVSVNTRKRALAWHRTYEGLGDPEDWNWIVVEKHARRLIRLLKKLGVQSSS